MGKKKVAQSPVEQCGWNNDTMLQLAEEFIQRRKLWDAYEEFLDDRAREELAESNITDVFGEG